MRSLDDIFGKKRSLDEIFAPSPQFSKEDIAKVKANNEEYAKRVEDIRPFFDKNPVGRLGVAVAQGISNSALNPAGYVARAYGMDTKPFTPQNAIERGVEKASEYGYDALALGGVGNIAKGAGYLGKGNTVTSKVLQDVFSPENLVTMALTPAVGGGFAEGVVNPTNEFERTLVNIVGGGALGGLASGVKQTSKPINKGLKGALPDNEANKALSKGIRASEEVAEQVSSQAPSAYNSLNDEMENALNKAVGRKLNYEKSISNQQERINDFIGKNADKELLDFSPSREQLKQYSHESIFNMPKKKISKEQAEEILFNRASKSGVDIDGTIEHYTDKGDRAQYLRTLSNTLENPDITFTSGDKGYVVKKYDANGEPFFDFVTKKDGKLYNKFNTNAKYVDNQIQKTAENVSLSGRVQQPTDAGYIRPATELDNNIAQQTVIVNRNLPRLKQFTQGLDEFQVGALNQAIDKGATMSTNSKGSLGATHRAQEVLNDMIEASYDTSIIGQKKPTTETRELMGVKDRLKQILEPSGIKPYDASYSKAQALKSAFEKGYNFKPSELKFENMGLATRRDKQAFLQGRMQKLLDNTLSDGGTNLATVIKKDENTLKKLMSKDKFDNLMNTADKIETQFKRLKSLEGQANRRLVKDTTTGSSINRENFESRGAMLGRLSDIIGGAINRGRNIDIAKQYLNSDELVTRGGLKGFLKGSGTTGTRQLLIDLLNNE